MFVRSVRKQPIPQASRFGMWTREPRPGVTLRVAGYADKVVCLDQRKDKRADQIVKLIGEEVPKEMRDSVVDGIVNSKDEGRDPHISFWLLSNNRVDSYNSTLAWDGWDLGDFKRNPGVLLAHDSSADKALPIGEDIGVYMDPARKALMGVTRYVSQELAGKDSLEARAVRWVKAGFLRAVSVGFEPIDFDIAEERDTGDWFVPMDFKRQALREYSVVPVPANPDALGEGRGFAQLTPQDVENFAADIERSLDGAGWLALPRATLETMRSAIKGTRMQVEVGGDRFVVTRADDYAEEPKAENQTESAAESTMTCPACGYAGPESTFAAHTSAGQTPIAGQMQSKHEHRADDTTTVQTLIFSKTKFGSADAAKKWATDHDYSDDKVDETEDSFRLRQKDPGDFAEDSFRTIELTDGVSAVVGKLKAASAPQLSAPKLDGNARARQDDAKETSAAQVAANVIEALDAFALGRLP